MYAIRSYYEQGKSVRYLNSGDWVENLTALEYHKSQWRIYRYTEDETMKQKATDQEEDEHALVEMDNKAIFRKMLSDFQS